MLVDLLSEEAHHLYEQLVASGGRPVDDALGPEASAVQELIRRGLAWQVPAPVPRICAVSPVTAMRRLLSQEQQNVIRAHRQIIERYAELEVLERRYPAGTPVSSEVEVLSGAEELSAAAFDLLAGAREQCRSVLGPRLGELGATGPATQVRQRRLIPTRSLEDPGLRDTVEAAAATGVEYRVLPQLPAPMLLTESAAMVRLGSPEATGLLVRGAGLLDSLTRLFDLLWTGATPLTGPVARPADAPSSVQLQILRLAAAGLKDEAIARSLGRSVRWVRRHFELLEEVLGATNRMTLGIAATRRGWV